MARKRKRQRAPDEGCRAPKRKRASKDTTSLREGPSTAVAAAPKTAASDGAPSPSLAPGHHAPSVQHALLCRYYPRVETLRAYLLTRLPASSRLRRKKLRLVGQRGTDTCAVEQLLSRLLDTVLVGCPAATDTGDSGGQPDEHDRQQMRITFSQDRRADESYGTVTDVGGDAFSLQSEIVDFVIWLLFQRAKRRAGVASRGFGDFPEHVLCHGFQRGKPFVPYALADDAEATSRSPVRPPPPCTIPGLHASRLNQHAQTLKEMPWPQLLTLLGASGESIMTDLLLDCSLFLPVDAGHDNYVQLTGKPLGDLITPAAGTPPVLSDAPTAASAPDKRSWAEIQFVRSRMFYARPSSTKKGAVHFGLKHIHVLNRYPYRTATPATMAATEQELAAQNRASTVHIMMYIFPKQFGLHNVFTSSVNRTTTTQKFQDYTLREDEIADMIQGRPKVSVPRRLRGLPMRLVEMLRIRHQRCSYYELLQHYCPVATPAGEVAAGSMDMVQQATPVAQVSAFCQAVFKRVVPDAFWGTGDVQAANRAVFLKKIDAFLRLRRYETFSLHGLLQGLKVADVAWLAPPHLAAPSGDGPGRSRGRPHLASTDLQKRRELWAEFLYYLIDSLLIPLLRTNFYITESGLHRNRIFYFRHDVWRSLAEPALASLKADMFEEVPQRSALESRDLTFGQVRLLPKRAALRPIMNLRRRAAVVKGTKQLASSTNAVLAPVASMLRYEMKQHPERLGATMESVNTILTRLKAFKQSIAAKTFPLPTFYFAKVDVKAAFDTIPQDAMVALLRTLPSHSLYHIDRFVEIAAPETTRSGSADAAALSARKWRAEARAYSDSAGFHDLVEGTLAAARSSTVFVDAAFRKTCEAAQLVGLATEHIQQNLVKIGKKYYRQRRGIPQGSVLSSALCNYFYADLEATELAFLRDGTEADCLLLRLIDDFLLVTTNRAKAARFVEVMHRGHPGYGVAVNPKKTLVNFALDVEGQTVPRLRSGALFPYCGTYIHCATLNLMRDRETKNQLVFDTITVEQARMPGYHFQRKVLSFFKYQAKPMFFDTAHNTLRITLRNLHDAFAETATKMWAYARCLPKDQRPRAALTTDTIQKLGELAYVLLSGPTRRERLGFAFEVSKTQMQWIMLCAFWSVLHKRQSGYAAELAWLRDALRDLRTRHNLRLPQEFLQGIPS